MYDPPGYLWLIIVAATAAIAAATCVLLYSGAVRAGLGRASAALLAGSAAVLLGGWSAATAVIADHGWYHTLPWALPAALAGPVVTLLALTRIPVVTRALAAPGMSGRLLLPHSFRVAAGIAFFLYLALGHLPAVFVWPAGLGDIATGLAAPVAARTVARGTGRRGALWFNAFGLTDLVVAQALGAAILFGLISTTPSGVAITELPLTLIPTVAVPVLFVLHIRSVFTLARAPHPRLSAASPVIARSGA
jgi:hypothetical protein